MRVSDLLETSLRVDLPPPASSHPLRILLDLYKSGNVAVGL